MKASSSGVSAPRPPDPLSRYPWDECEAELGFRTTVVLLDLVRFVGRSGHIRGALVSPAGPAVPRVTVKVGQPNETQRETQSLGAA